MTKISCCALLWLFCLQSVCSSGSAAQIEKQLTSAETQGVQEVVNLFIQRLQETGDLTTVIRELYVKDFIQRYLTQQHKMLTEEPRISTDIYFASGLRYQAELLDQAKVEDWRRLYIATYNFLYYGFVVVMNHSAKKLLKGEEPDLTTLENIYPPKVVQLFNEDPILKNFILKKGTQKPISTIEEMRAVTARLEQALAILHQDKSRQSYKLTEDGKKVIELLKDVLRKENPPQVIDKEFYGYPQGTRVFAVQTPLIFKLYVVNIDGKYQIVWAEPLTD